MFLDTLLKAISRNTEENTSKKLIKDLKKAGLRKVELDENMNCTLIFADKISKAKEIKRFNEESPKIRERFINEFKAEFDAGCGSHEEILREDVRVWVWTLE